MFRGIVVIEKDWGNDGVRNRVMDKGENTSTAGGTGSVESD